MKHGKSELCGMFGVPKEILPGSDPVQGAYIQPGAEVEVSVLQERILPGNETGKEQGYVLLNL
jgi:hypothetical protein